MGKDDGQRLDRLEHVCGALGQFNPAIVGGGCEIVGPARHTSFHSAHSLRIVDDNFPSQTNGYGKQ